jgi:hypothetical protein
MFRITEDPSSGRIVQCLAKNYKDVSIVSVDTDVVLNYTHKHNGLEYAAITPTLSMLTDTIEPYLQFFSQAL